MNLNQYPFQGQFRNYQQRVLDHAQSYLDDGKIHIVAAPGSGKTILGLELITRLNQPTLILSPSITIKHQWMERFTRNFLTSPDLQSAYVSSTVLDLKPITSITYQALHAAMTQTKLEESDEVESETEAIDFSQFNLVKQCIAYGIKTICLDEAHHLRSEWHKSLTNFIKALGTDIKIIALTATPPYDSSQSEWDKYISLCGEIDEEIFIPELVHQKTLAPHQDYLYFNYPSDAEVELIQTHRNHAIQIYQTLKSNDEFRNLLGLIYRDYESNLERILEQPDDFIAFMVLLQDIKLDVSQKLIKTITNQKKLPAFNMAFLEQGLTFVLKHEDTYPYIQSIKQYLIKHNLIERNKLSLYYNAKIIKTLIGSAAKLSSVQTIVKHEAAHLGSQLRMVILTDFIKKEHFSSIHTDLPLSTIGTTTLFETVRRTLPRQSKLALLSGSLVILPTSVSQVISNHPDWDVSTYQTTPISTEFMTVTFKGSNKHKVKLITALFEAGHIEVIIGTASLLGEGWDSPAVNSLILASYVGSFMLSNQMRGRAIRIDPKHPEKVSNIWHLVSIEPKPKADTSDVYQLDIISVTNDKIHSADFETLKKRFDCFMGPAYSKDVIESGIDRIDILNPPFHKQKYDKINAQMLNRSQDRAAVRTAWSNSIDQFDAYGIFERIELIKPKIPTSTNFYHYSRAMLMSSLFILLNSFARVNMQSNDFRMYLFVFVYLFVLLGLYYAMNLLFKNVSPLNYIQFIGRSILNTMKDQQLLESNLSKVRVVQDEYKIHTHIELANASQHDQHLFSKAMSTVLLPMDNPRYIIIQKGWFGLKYKHSFSAPEFIQNAEIAQNLEKHLSKFLDRYVLIYTRNVEGRKHLLKAKLKSFINKNDRALKKVRAVNKQ